MEKNKNPRFLAVKTLNMLEKKEDFLGEVLNFHLKQGRLTPLNKAFYTELVSGTVRMRKNLDYVLGLFSRRPLKKIQPTLLNILRLGAYQILYLDRVPVSAGVNESVKLARYFGHQGTADFTNALLRKIGSMQGAIVYPSWEQKPGSHLAFKYSFPLWVVELWINWLGREETLQLCRAFNQRPEMHLRANTLRVTPQEVASHFMNLGADVTPGSFTPEIVKVKPGSLAVRDSWLKQGKYYIQDESSALAAHALGVQPGHLVYDLCSAPGGKATHLGQLMENRGRILAIDADPRRILRVEENARRLGITIIETRKADASKELNLKPAPRVLVDAPCTGWGTIRKRPDLRWRKKPSDVAKLIQIQRKILSRAARCVQKGGLLLYSTCTINKGENQDQAQWFLAEHPDFSGFPLPSWFPEPLGEPPWQRQLFPQIHNLDGFFLALFRKG